MYALAAFYRFADIAEPAALRGAIEALGRDEGLRGTVLLAAEGVNGTVAGRERAVARLIDRLRAEPGLARLRETRSAVEEMPFSRFRVRLKREIVTMGRPALRPTEQAGPHVAPEDWNALISAPDVALIDTRNAYEVALGTFEGAVDPGLARFADFPAWWEANAHRFAGRPVAMFCTGGIRCEKSTALARVTGSPEVYHLEGGILGYLARLPEARSKWRGECFVFDRRVSVAHGLAPGLAGMCHACGRPVTPAQMAAPGWEEGVSCPWCISEYSDADRGRFRERQRQVRLAAAHGRRHLA